MNKKLRFMIIALCFCMILPILVGCAKKKGNGFEDQEKGYYDGSSRERTPDMIDDDFSLNGKRIGVYYGGHIEKYCIGYEDVVDIVFSKIFERNVRVRNRLKCDLEFVSSETKLFSDFPAKLTDIIFKKDDTNQIIMSTNNSVVQFKLFNHFHDLNDAEYIDINEPWYSKDSIMELSVDNYYYRFIYGDINIMNLGYSGAIYYNKDLYQQYINQKNRDYLYQLVLDGQWTIDQLNSLTKRSHIQKGGNGENDIYGYSLFRHAEPIHYLAAGCNVPYYKRANNGLPEIIVDNERSYDFTNKLYKFIFENEGAWLFFPGRIGEEVGHENDFPNGKVMFLLSFLDTCLQDNMREMESDFGILPYPKWDEDQEEYINFMANGSVLTGIPIIIDIDEAMGDVSAVIEALSSESYRSVMVPFYETALQNTYSRDDIASQMVDIITGQHDTIKSRLTKNLLYEYTSYVSLGNIFGVLMEGESTEFASEYAARKDAAFNGLQNLISDYLKTSEG